MGDERLHYAPPARPQVRPAFFATLPTRPTRWLRTNLLWQVLRFAVINLKMIRLIALSHHQGRRLRS